VEYKFYKVVVGNTIETLSSRINMFLDQGYVLIGGVSMDKHGNYIQAIAEIANDNQE